MDSINEIRLVLSVLLESTLISITHAADLISLVFNKDDNEYAFHSQTLTRFIEANSILFTRTDYFNREDYNDENYDKTDLDLKLSLYRSSFENLKIISINVTDIGDISFVLENKLRIEAVIDSSIDSYGYGNEHWRFFDMKEENQHFVVSDNLKIERT